MTSFQLATLCGVLFIMRRSHYKGKTTQSRYRKKDIKIFFCKKIKLHCPRYHKPRLKTRYCWETHYAPFVRGRGSKRGTKTSFLATLSVFSAVFWCAGEKPMPDSDAAVGVSAIKCLLASVIARNWVDFPKFDLIFLI